MKKTCSIAFVSLATMILLFLSIVPHHHHKGGVTHFLVGHCNHHPESKNRQIPVHHESGHKHASGNAQSCIAESLFIAPPSQSEKKCKVSSCDQHNDYHQHFFSICYLVASLCDQDLDQTKLRPPYGNYILYDTSSFANRINGLRAPPVC